MSKRMVVVPLEVAKTLIEPLQGSEIFDLKPITDMQTIDKMNRELNRKDGEERQQSQPEPAKEVTETPVVKPKLLPKPQVASTPKRKDTMAQVKHKLQKVDAFDRKTKQVIAMDGKALSGSNIETILSHAYGPSNSKHPKGSADVASRLKLMNITDLPNSAFTSLIIKATPPSAKKRGQWKKF